MQLGRLLVAGFLLALWVSTILWDPGAWAQGHRKPPAFKVDPFWPKPLPVVKDTDGLSRHWITGEVGASCIDSHDHIVTVNRGFAAGGLLSQEGTQSIPAAPVVMYDVDGNIVTAGVIPTLTVGGRRRHPAEQRPRVLRRLRGQHLDRRQRRWRRSEMVPRRQEDAAADRDQGRV